jgi:hypothetical protein
MSGIGFGTKRPPDQPPEGPPAKRRNMAQAGPFASLPSPDAGSGDRDYVYALLGTGQMVVDFFAADAARVEQFLAWIDCSGIDCPTPVSSRTSFANFAPALPVRGAFILLA